MRLEEWLVAKRMKAGTFAGEIGVPSSTIYRILEDGRSPTYAVMQKIIAGTGGAVLPNDFFDLADFDPATRQAAAE